MGLLRTLILAFLTACSSSAVAPQSALTEQNPELEHVKRALDFQEKKDWASAEKEWNKLSAKSSYFPKAFYETQKLSYRLEKWNEFFAKAEIYKQAFQKNLYCPELFLLQSFAYTRNCLFKEAQKSLEAATKELDIFKPSQCSKITKATLKKQIAELGSVLRANEKLKASTPIQAIDDPLKRNLWPMNQNLFEKIQTLPLEEGLSLVGIEVKNRCGS